MFSQIFLRLEPLGLELVPRGAPRRSRCGDPRFAGRDRSPTSSVGSTIGGPTRFAFAQLFGERAGNDGSRESGARAPAGLFILWAATAHASRRRVLPHGEGALDCVLEGEGEASLVSLLEAAAGSATSTPLPGAVTRTGKVHHPLFVKKPGRSAAGARPVAASPALLSSARWTLAPRSNSPWLPVGLHLLQRLDLLRAQLPDRSPEVFAGELPQIREPGRVHRGRCGFHPGPARLGDRGGDRLEGIRKRS